jgi:hypothetical protein
MSTYQYLLGIYFLVLHSSPVLLSVVNNGNLLLPTVQHVRPLNDDGRSVSRDLDGFPVTCR